jgi:hypothetical protein
VAAPAANSQETSSSVSLSPGQAKFLYWFVGMVPILKALTPFTTYLGNRKTWLKKIAMEQGKSVKTLTNKALTKTALTDIYRNVLSDFARQTVTCSFQLMSYFIVGDLIKMGLNKFYSKMPADRQDPGLRQVLIQCIPLAVQVIATVLSRNMGAAELQALFDVDPKTGEYKTWHNKAGNPAPVKVPGSLTAKLQPYIKKFIDTSLREGGKATGNLRPVKASLIAIGAMTGYFSALVGLLYGSSAMLEKVFPDSFKTKKPNNQQPQPVATNHPLVMPATIGLGALAYNVAPRHPQQPVTAPISPHQSRFARPSSPSHAFPRPYYNRISPNPLSFSHL